MTRILVLVLALALCLPVNAQAAGKAAITQEAFYVTPYLGYYAGEVYCEVTNTGDKPIKVDSGVYEFFNADGDSIDSGSVYYVYPRVLLPGKKGYIVIQSGIAEAKEPAYIDDYSVSIVGKSAKAEDTTQYPTSNIRIGDYGSYGLYQAFYATVVNDTDAPTGNIAVAFGAYDADGALLYASKNATSGMSLLPGSSIEVYCTIDRDILDALEAGGKVIATITAVAYDD